MRRAALLLLIASPSFADTIATDTPTLTAPPTEWLGPEPHLVIMGKVNGRELNIQLTDMASAPFVAEFAGKREYLPGEAGAFRYGDFEVALKAEIGGVERSLELEFENDDFGKAALPSDFALVPENFPKGFASFLEFSSEWEDASGSVNDEIGGFNGTLSLQLDEGAPDDKGLRPDGMIGGLVMAEKEGEIVVVSFTVPVAEYEIDD
ncbi:hypothetical protein [Tabrizicola sp.]|uniref:hypothetical protein n=1 Tax=Tabrizicola sp. TaxID=2005166 RepID=UPI003F310804